MIPVLPRNVKCIITGNLRDTIFFFFLRVMTIWGGRDQISLNS